MPHYTPIDIVIAALAAVIIPAISAWSGKSLGSSVGRASLTARYWLIVARSALMILLIAGTWVQLGRSFSELGLGFPIGRWGLAGFGIDVAIVAYYSYAIILRKRSAAELEAARERLRRMQSDRMLPQTRAEFMLFPAVAILGSSFEELAYRGFLIWFLAPIAGLVGAVLLSSAIFGLGHAYQGRRGIMRTGIIGLVFGSAYALTQSLWWLALAHIIVNLFGVPLQRRLQRDA